MEMFVAYDWKPFQSCFESFMTVTFFMGTLPFGTLGTTIIKTNPMLGQFDLKKPLVYLVIFSLNIQKSKVADHQPPWNV
jgi:hypothetical protein